MFKAVVMQQEVPNNSLFDSDNHAHACKAYLQKRSDSIHDAIDGCRQHARPDSPSATSQLRDVKYEV
jgi:sarcosine oxidase delta subunit